LTQDQTNAPSEKQLLRHRKEKAQFLLDAGIPLYPNDFRRSDEIGDVLEAHGDKNEDIIAQEDLTFALCGRIMAHRSFGKATFFHIQDTSGKIQVYAQRDDLGVEQYGVFKKFEIGDIVGVNGKLFRTKTGEITIKSDEVRLLSKSMRPLPEKYHGLKDVETRYRQRYVDLLVNDRAKEIFRNARPSCSTSATS
jgi:Lysyl-tRNA synthetase (class II)